MIEFQINEDITIIYSEDDREYIDKLIKEFKKYLLKILTFFGIDKLDKKLQIKLWNNSNLFKNQIFNKYNLECPFWVTGISINHKDSKLSRIDYLSLKEIKKINYHKNTTIDELIKGVIHEFVHTAHSQFCNYRTPDDLWIIEGLATYLSDQYESSKLDVSLDKVLGEDYIEYYNYRAFFDMVIDIVSKEELQYLIKNGLNTTLKSKITNNINNNYQ